MSLVASNPFITGISQSINMKSYLTVFSYVLLLDIYLCIISQHYFPLYTASTYKPNDFINTIIVT